MPLSKNGDVAYMKSRLSSIVRGPSSVVRFMLLVVIGTLLMSCTDEERRTSDVGRRTTGYDYCLRCHGADGSGSPTVPDIRDRPIWRAHPDSVLFVLVFGMATQYSEDSVMRTMPPVPYTDEEIAAVGEYANRVIGKREVKYTAEDVKRVRQSHKEYLSRHLRFPASP